MADTRTFVCFANSRKTGGTCVAGKRLIKGLPAEWIRPVSTRPTQELAHTERMYSDFTEPKLLDIIEVQFKQHVPHNHQVENHLIDPRRRWVHRGAIEQKHIYAYLDFPATLWATGFHQQSCHNSRMPAHHKPAFPWSLALIHPDCVIIEVATEPFRDSPRQHPPKKKIRADFRWNGIRPKFPITDPVIENKFRTHTDGEYPLYAVLCVSMGEAHTDGFFYKFVAGVIPV